MSIRQSEAHSTVAGRLGALVLIAAILSVATGLLPDKAAAANGTTVTASDGTGFAIPGETIYVTSPNYGISTSCDLEFVDSAGNATVSDTCTSASPGPLQGSLVVPLAAAVGVATVYVCQLQECSSSLGLARIAAVQGPAQGTITIESAVSVPNVVGMLGSAAVTALASAGLSAQPSGPPTGTVIAQSPAAGVGVKPKSAVLITLVVLVPVPDLHGLTATGANHRLSVIHLRLVGVVTAPGKVVNQNPEPNQLVPEYSSVTVALLAPVPTPSSPPSSAAVVAPTPSVTSPRPAPTPSPKVAGSSSSTFTGLRDGFVLGLIGLVAAGAAAGRTAPWIRRVRARRIRRWFSTHVDMTVTTEARTEMRGDNVSPSRWPAVEMSWSSLRSSSLYFHGGAA